MPKTIVVVKKSGGGRGRRGSRRRSATPVRTRSSSSRRSRSSRSSRGSRRSAKPFTSTRRRVKAIIPEARIARFAKKRGGASESGIMGFMNPASNRRLRLTHAADATRTAVFGLHNSIQLTATQGVSTNGPSDIFVAGQVFFALFRNPLRNMVIFTPNFNNYPYSYAAQFVIGATTPGSTSTLSAAFPLQNSASDVEPLNPIVLLSTLTYAPHGDSLFCGSYADINERYIWVDKAAIITFVITGTAQPDYIMVRRCSNVITDLTNDLSVASGTAVFTAAESSYYSFVYVHMAAHSGLSLSMTLSGAGDVCAHYSPPRLWDKVQEFTTCRVNATAFLLSNDSTAMNIGGTIWATEIPGDQYWPNYASASRITNSAEFVRHHLATGAYAWARPGGAETEHYTSFGNDGKYPGRLTFPLFSQTNVVILLAESAQVGPTYPGLDLTLTTWVTIESHTTSQYYEIAFASLNRMATERLITRISRVPIEDIIMDNPHHIEAIRSFVSRGLGHMRQHAGKIGAAISMLFPQYGMLASAAGAALQS